MLWKYIPLNINKVIHWTEMDGCDVGLLESQTMF